MSDTIMSGIVCPHHQLPLKNGLCPECGDAWKNQQVKTDKKVKVKEVEVVLSHQNKQIKCPQCGIEVLDETAQFCPQCGYEFKKKSRVDADLKEEDIPQESNIKLLLKGESEEIKEVPLKLITRPYGFWGKFRNLEFLVFPDYQSIYLSNPLKDNIFLKIEVPYFLTNLAEIRLGKLPFVLHYAQDYELEQPDQTVLIGNSVDVSDSYAVDCLQCIHPNFPNKILNLNTNIVELNRGILKQLLSIEDQKILTKMGVSSKSIYLKRYGKHWYLFPESNPNVLVKIVGTLIPYAYPQPILYGNEVYTIMNIVKNRL